MKKSKIATKKKDSILVVPVSEIQITEDTTCVVNYALLGAFKERQSNASSKEEIWKMKASPILDENKKGRFICAHYGAPGRKLRPDEALPKNFYMGSKEYKPYSVATCYQRRTYSSESLLYLSSEEARPFGVTKKAWEMMSTNDRLRMQFAIEAASVNPVEPSFNFEFVN